MKRFRRITLILIIAVLVLASFAGCEKKQSAVDSIEIVSGSFKESYALDSDLELSGAQLNVTYKDGNKETIPITREMVSNFDTYTTTNSRILTVTYGGAKAEFIYKVNWNGGAVDTPVRLSAEAVSGATFYTVTVTAQNCARVANGVYALKFYLSLNSAVTFVEFESALPEGWKLKQEVSGKNLKFIAYSETGRQALPDSQPIVRVKVTKGSGRGTVTLQNLSISDGTRDYTVPVTSSQIVL